MKECHLSCGQGRPQRSIHDRKYRRMKPVKKVTVHTTCNCPTSSQRHKTSDCTITWRDVTNLFTGHRAIFCFSKPANDLIIWHNASQFLLCFANIVLHACSCWTRIEQQHSGRGWTKCHQPDVLLDTALNITQLQSELLCPLPAICSADNRDRPC